jgi:hypothetical protein
VSAFDDWFAKNMPDAERWLQQLAAEPVAGRPNVEPMGEPIVVRKLTGFIEVSDDLLMDYGVIPDTRPKPPPPPWRTRLRRKITATVANLRERAARRAYKIIAGEWPDNGEGDW